jgi:hypothetical protein
LEEKFAVDNSFVMYQKKQISMVEIFDFGIYVDFCHGDFAFLSLHSPERLESHC